MKNYISMILILLCLVGTCTVFAADVIYEKNGYGFQLKSVDQAGMSTYVYKYPEYSCAQAKITYQSVLNRPTNMLVVASDGTQITYNYIVPGEEVPYLCQLVYYSEMHEGNVALRGNTGSTLVDYVVSGYWTPNWSTGVVDFSW